MAEINGRVGWRTFVSSTTTTNPLWDNVVAYYTGDSTANDAKGTANGTLVNGATYATGKINNGFSFDGINDYANFGNNIDLTGLAPFSFNFWVSPTAATANAVFFSKYDGNKGYLIRKSANGNYVNIAILSSGSNYISVSSNSIVIPSNSYSMITVTYNGTPNISGFKIYVNATSDTLTALYQAFTTSASNTSNFLMGSLATNANFYNGVIDEIGVWDIVLTQAQVTELYNAGAGKQYVAPTPTSIITTGLIMNLDASNSASYPGTGTTWTDLTGSGTIATLVNGTSYSSENGGTLVFDGINDNISINNGNGLDIGNTYTFSIWVKFSGFNGYGTVLAGSSAFYDSGYAMTIGNSTIMYIAAGMNYISTNPNLTTNQWVCLTVVRNPTSVIWYKNGVSIGSGSMITTANNVIKAIGAYQNGSGSLNGNISSVNIYNRNLSASEILQNFNTTKTRFGF